LSRRISPNPVKLQNLPKSIKFLTTRNNRYKSTTQTSEANQAFKTDQTTLPLNEEFSNTAFSKLTTTNRTSNLSPAFRISKE